MIKANREGQEMQFDDTNELLIFIVENMVLRSELESGLANVRSEMREVEGSLKAEIQGLRLENKKEHAEIRDCIDTKTNAIKHDTAELLQAKGIITKQEGLQYIRGSV